MGASDGHKDRRNRPENLQGLFFVWTERTTFRILTKGVGGLPRERIDKVNRVSLFTLNCRFIFGIIDITGDAQSVSVRLREVIEMPYFIVSNLQNYTMQSAGKVTAELKHEVEKGYNNPDLNPERTKDNTILYHDSSMDGKTYNQYVKDFREENNVKGRLTTSGDKATKVLSAFVVSASPEFFRGMSDKEQDRYFKNAWESLKEQFPSYHWTDVVVHRDERTPHMHAYALPLYQDPCKGLTFNATMTQGGNLDKTIYKTYEARGSQFFKEFQDNLYRDLSRNWNVERGISSDRKKMESREYKEIEAREKNIELRTQAVNDKEKDLQREIDRYKNEPVPRQTILLGTYKYSKGEVDKIVIERNTLLTALQQQKEDYRELETKALRAIKAHEDKQEQAEYDRDRALEERDKAIEIGREISNDKARNKALDRLEEWGVNEPLHMKTHDREMTISGR